MERQRDELTGAIAELRQELDWAENVFARASAPGIAAE